MRFFNFDLSRIYRNLIVDQKMIDHLRIKSRIIRNQINLLSITITLFKNQSLPPQPPTKTFPLKKINPLFKSSIPLPLNPTDFILSYPQFQPRKTKNIPKDNFLAIKITPLIPYNTFQMSLTPSLHPLTKKINISQSIEYELTPTAKSNQYLEQSSSMLSLSNYLQQDQSNLCFNTKHKLNKNSIHPEKHKIFNEIQCAQKLFIRHLENEFHDYSQDSESMLLAYSSIKENKLENSHFFNQDNKNTLNAEDKEQIHSQHSVFPSRINPKSNHMNKLICTDSIELIQLLSIPKDTSFEKSQQFSSKNHQPIENQELAKIQQIYQIIHSNKNLSQKINFLPAQIHSNLTKCFNCLNLNKKIQYLQTQLTQKQRQIKKYDSLIQKLNSNIFDLKIENKQLFFQNKQYSAKIQTLLQLKNQKPTIQRVKTVNFDHQDNSLDNILKQSNGVSSSYANLSRKTTKIYEDFNKNTDSQNMEEVQHCYTLFDKKNYAQTPMPSYSQAKQKKVRRSSNHSDEKARISISQLRQPNIYQISEVKTQTSEQKLRENNREQAHLVDKKIKCNHKSEKNIMRFSDLSKEINYQSNGKKDFQSKKKSPHQPLSQKSTTKAHGFLKVKSNQIQQKIQSLKSHPLNKISQQDNYSQNSETKTQKLYGLTKSSTKQPIYQFIDYNIVEPNKLPSDYPKSLTRNGSDKVKRQEKESKHSIIYKSFKQIGNLQENQYLKRELKVEKKGANVGLSYEEDASGLNMKNQTSINGTLRNRQKSERNFFSPSPYSLASRYQNSIKIDENHSTYMKTSGLKSQMKSFIR